MAATGTVGPADCGLTRRPARLRCEARRAAGRSRRQFEDVDEVPVRVLHELAVKLAACDGITVSAVSYDDTAAYELEVTLVSAPHHDPIVIGRSQAGDRCQITLERWLPIDGEPGIEHAVNTIHAILAASARPNPARIVDTTAEP